MTRGRHDRRRTRRKTQRRYRIRSALAGFAVVALCVVAVIVVASRDDDPATRTAGADSSTTLELAPSGPDPATESDETTTSRPEPTTSEPATDESAGPDESSTASLAGRVIVIDPGHNGGNGSHPAEINRQVPMAEGQTKECDTTGTQTNDGYPEHVFTFDVATRVADELRARGATVHLTRPDDSGVGPCVDERAASGGNHGADVAISIHGDGGGPNVRGFHVMPPAGCSGCNNGIVEPSARFATILRDTFRSQTPMPVADYMGRDGIMPRSDLAGINLSTVPKVFIECGNMRNATDAALMKSGEFRQQAAEAIANGIALYLASA